jgi:iron complex transport system substrate-binding protein
VTAARTLLLAVAVLHSGAAQTPRRIVSTAPGITEILFALGLGDRVVGVTQYCRYPAEAARLPKIGSWTTPNMETVVALKPDLVIVQRTAVHDSTRFNALKLRTVDVRLHEIADIYATVETIGKAAGVASRAAALNERLRADLTEVQNRIRSRPKVPALFVVGRNPGALEGMIAAGPKSYHDELITLAGGRNILADSPVSYVKVLHEELLARKPEVIIDMGEHADASGIAPEQIKKEIALWRRFATVPAVRNGRVHIVANAIYVVPGPRVVECARQLARFLHPEAFR